MSESTRRSIVALCGCFLFSDMLLCSEARAPQKRLGSKIEAEFRESRPNFALSTKSDNALLSY